MPTSARLGGRTVFAPTSIDAKQKARGLPSLLVFVFNQNQIIGSFTTPSDLDEVELEPSFLELVSSLELVSTLELVSSLELVSTLELVLTLELVSSLELVSTLELVFTLELVSSLELVSTLERVSSLEVVLSLELVSALELVSSLELICSLEETLSFSLLEVSLSEEGLCELTSSSEDASDEISDCSLWPRLEYSPASSLSLPQAASKTSIQRPRIKNAFLNILLFFIPIFN